MTEGSARPEYAGPVNLDLAGELHTAVLGVYRREDGTIDMAQMLLGLTLLSTFFMKAIGMDNDAIMVVYNEAVAGSPLVPEIFAKTDN